MRITATLLAIAALLPTGATARTPTPPDDHDVTCFFVVSAMISQETGDPPKEAMFAAAYFGGKIYGADPNYDLAAAAKTEAPKLTKDKMAELGKECGGELQTFGDWLTDAGKKMAAAGL